MKRVIAPVLVIVGLVGIALAGYWFKQQADARPVACIDPVAGCHFEHAGTPVQLRFSRRPVPLKAFQLDIHSVAADRISAEFQMQGMEMGFNRYDLSPTPGSAFTAQVTLPVCVSGRHDWTMFLTIDGTRYAVPFSTH
ncbi:MAG: hypothetical protein IV085_09455 [Thiobacillus sp.]|nr:hypothetical protein [Thiobacillus sp.]